MKRRAITLVELTLIVALAAIVVTVTIRGYAQSQRASGYNTLIAHMSQLRAAANQAIMANVTPANVPTAVRRYLPVSFFRSDDWIPTGSGALLRIYEDWGYYAIAAVNLPPELCVKIAMLDVGDAVKWIINTQMPPDPIGDGVAYISDARRTNPDQLRLACAANPNSIAWGFAQ